MNVGKRRGGRFTHDLMGDKRPRASAMNHSIMLTTLGFRREPVSLSL